MVDYSAFLQAKRPIARAVGIAVAQDELPSGLFDYQGHCAAFALERGRTGIFLDTGLGKTLIELAFAERAARETGKPALILCPLAVAWQTGRKVHVYQSELVKSRAKRNTSAQERRSEEPHNATR